MLLRHVGKAFHISSNVYCNALGAQFISYIVLYLFPTHWVKLTHTYLAMFDGLKKRNGDSVRDENYSTDSQVISHIQDDASPVILPGELSLEEDTSGGLGRHLGLFSTTFLMYVFSFVDISFYLKDICSPL